MATKRYDHITDQELLQKYRHNHNSEWLGILLQRYILLLFGVCMKFLKNETEAKDGVQQIFLKVIQEVSKYKIDYFKSWLYTVAKNYCLSTLRDKKGKILNPLNVNDLVQTEEQEVEEEHIPPELLHEAIEELNIEQKQCITLFYLQKKSYQQIVEEKSYSLLQVKSYIQNGKRNLKLLIAEKLKQKYHKNE